MVCGPALAREAFEVGLENDVFWRRESREGILGLPLKARRKEAIPLREPFEDLSQKANNNFGGSRRRALSEPHTGGKATHQVPHKSSVWARSRRMKSLRRGRPVPNASLPAAAPIQRNHRQKADLPQDVTHPAPGLDLKPHDRRKLQDRSVPSVLCIRFLILPRAWSEDRLTIQARPAGQAPPAAETGDAIDRPRGFPCDRGRVLGIAGRQRRGHWWRGTRGRGGGRQQRPAR